MNGSTAVQATELAIPRGHYSADDKDAPDSTTRAMALAFLWERSMPSRCFVYPPALTVPLDMPSGGSHGHQRAESSAEEIDRLYPDWLAAMAAVAIVLVLVGIVGVVLAAIVQAFAWALASACMLLAGVALFYAALSQAEKFGARRR